MTTSYRHGSIVGPIMLIGFGAVLLLDNLGQLRESPWVVLLTLWPVILVVAGLDLAIGYRSLAGAVTAAILSLLVLGGSLAWMSGGRRLGSEPAGETIQVALNGVTSAEVSIDPVASSLRATSLDNETYLLTGRIASQRVEQVSQTYERTGDHARVGLETSGASATPFMGLAASAPTWDLSFTPIIPLEVAVGLVAGQADLDLAELTAEALDVDVIFGQSSVVLPAHGVYAARLAGVFGQTSVLIPAGLEASVRIEPLLAARTIDNDLRPLPDGRYATAGYGQAENQVDLVVSQVIGAIDIQAE